MNTPISFEIAKLLKEKGFDEALTFYFDLQDSNKLKPIPMSDEINKFHSNRNSLMLSAPTIADVVMWLYEKHGIWISVNKDINIKWSNNYFNYNIISENKGSAFSDIGGTQPNSPTEAYEAAIEYTLNNLI